MTLNGVGESDFQAAPGLGVNLNGRNFFTGKSVVGAEERCVAISIKRLSAKVRDVDIIPWCDFIMPLKRSFGIVAGCDDSSISTRFGSKTDRLSWPGKSIVTRSRFVSTLRITFFR